MGVICLLASNNYSLGITNEALTIDYSGNVGIGTVTPQSKLQVRQNGNNLIWGHNNPNYRSALGVWDGGGNPFIAFHAEHSTSPNMLKNDDAGLRGMYILHDQGNPSSLLFRWNQSAVAGDLFNNVTDVMTVRSDGTVGIGTTTPDATVKLHVAGSVRVDQNIAAKYQDFAEWVPAREQILGGTVVVVDPKRPNHVLPSSQAYDTSVAGVVSERPGLLLGEAGEEKVIVATVGRVKVRADASKGSIRIGDLLVTSDSTGMAMRSEPLQVAGTQIHRPGTLLGKALEPLPAGQGEILILLSLQ